MPKLPQYTAQLGDAPISAGRRATGEDFGGGVAEAIGGLARQATKAGQQIIDDAEQRDARQAQVEHAKIRQKYAKALEDAEISGGDVDAIREKLEQEVDGVRSTVATRTGLQTADIHAANTLNVFDTRSAQVKATRAGIEARMQGAEWINAQGATLATNPSYLPIAEQEADAFASTFAGRLPPEKVKAIATELKQQANVAAVKALTRMAPENTLERLEKGEWNLTPDQRAQEIGRAQSQIDAREARRQSQMRFAEWERGQRSEQARDGFIKQVFSNSLNEEEVVSDPALTPADREHLIVFNKRWWDAKMGEEKKSNPLVVRDLLTRVYAAEDDPGKIRTNTPLLEAVKRGEVNTSDFRWLNTAVAEQRDPNNSTIGAQFYHMSRSLESAFTNDLRYSSTPGGRIKAAEIINRWTMAVRKKMDEKREKGESLFPLFDPTNKEYVGDARYVKQFELGAGGTPTVTTEEAYKDLPAGANYLDAQGNLRRKRTLVESIPP